MEALKNMGLTLIQNMTVVLKQEIKNEVRAEFEDRIEFLEGQTITLEVFNEKVLIDRGSKSGPLGDPGERKVRFDVSTINGGE